MIKNQLPRIIGTFSITLVIYSGSLSAEDTNEHPAIENCGANTEVCHAIIDERRGLLDEISDSIDVVAGMAKKKIDFDTEAAKNAADTLAQNSEKLATELMWPAGSDSKGSGHEKTRAKASIWNDGKTEDAFLEIFSTLNAASVVLTQNVDSLDSLRSSLGAVGKTCKQCHTDYRGKRR